MNEALVSVIIPTYKRSEGLYRAVNSVLSQSYLDVEVVVVDDNDPDSEWRKKTSNLMKMFSNEKKVKYVQHEKNINGSAARNTGLKNSSGCYVCFLDDDDFYYCNKIEMQVDFLKNNPQFDACFCDYAIGECLSIVEFKENYTREIFLCEKTPQTSGWMVTRKCLNVLNGFDEDYQRHQDYEFLLRFYRMHFRMGKINEVLYERTQTCIDNTPQGKKREFMKKKLFSDFHEELACLMKTDSDFSKCFYPINYVPIFTNYLKYGCVKDSIRVLFFLIMRSPFQTIFIFCKRVIFFIKRKIKLYE